MGLTSSTFDVRHEDMNGRPRSRSTKSSTSSASSTPITPSTSLPASPLRNNNNNNNNTTTTSPVELKRIPQKGGRNRAHHSNSLPPSRSPTSISTLITALKIGTGGNNTKKSSSPKNASEEQQQQQRTPEDFAKDTRVVTFNEDEEGNKMINEYTLLRTIGSGSYAKVKLCMDSNNRAYAVKIMNKSYLKRVKKGDSDALQDVRREVAIMKRLRHPNIVRLYEIIDDPAADKLFLVMEYVEKGCVMQLDENHCSSEVFSEKLAKRYLKDIIAGLEYLHSQKIIHRDIKPQNLLLDSNDVLKVSDFGVSSLVKGEDDTLKANAGTPAFLPPEACGEETFSGKPADVWAVGVTLYIFIFGKTPFTGESFLEIYNEIRTKKQDYPTPVSANLLDLFERILDKNPKTRITLPELKKHPWLTSTDEGDFSPSVSPNPLATATPGGTTTTTGEGSPRNHHHHRVHSEGAKSEANNDAINVSEADIENAIIVGNTEKMVDQLVMLVNIKHKLKQKAKEIRERTGTTPGTVSPSADSIFSTSPRTVTKAPIGSSKLTKNVEEDDDDEEVVEVEALVDDEEDETNSNTNKASPSEEEQSNKTPSSQTVQM